MQWKSRLSNQKRKQTVKPTLAFGFEATPFPVFVVAAFSVASCIIWQNSAGWLSIKHFLTAWMLTYADTHIHFQIHVCCQHDAEVVLSILVIPLIKPHCLHCYMLLKQSLASLSTSVGSPSSLAHLDAHFSRDKSERSQLSLRFVFFVRQLAASITKYLHGCSQIKRLKAQGDIWTKTGDCASRGIHHSTRENNRVELRTHALVLQLRVVAGNILSFALRRRIEGWVRRVDECRSCWHGRWVCGIAGPAFAEIAALVRFNGFWELVGCWIDAAEGADVA